MLKIIYTLTKEYETSEFEVVSRGIVTIETEPTDLIGEIIAEAIYDTLAMIVPNQEESTTVFRLEVEETSDISDI